VTSSEKDDLFSQMGEEYLVLQLNNERPISVADLAALYLNLARDYKKFSRGRELEIVSISEGSLISVFKDAVGFASGANSLISFARALAGLLAFAVKEKSEIDLPKASKNVSRTAENLAKIAANSSSRIQIKYKRDAKREELLITASPAEAKKALRYLAKPSPKSESKMIGADQHSYRLAPPELKIGAALTRLAEQATEGISKTSDIHALIEGFVEILIEKGLTYVLASIADDLDSRGIHEAADLVRNKTYEATSRKNLPPILTRP
jgi:hypothetical protein